MRQRGDFETHGNAASSSEASGDSEFLPFHFFYRTDEEQEMLRTCWAVLYPFDLPPPL